MFPHFEINSAINTTNNLWIKKLTITIITIQILVLVCILLYDIDDTFREVFVWPSKEMAERNDPSRESLGSVCCSEWLSPLPAAPYK